MPADRLAYGRAPEEFRNAVLAERENGDWAHTIVRAWLYDQADAVRLATLVASPLGSFAALAKTVQREEKYHLMFSLAWLERLAGAGDDSRGRMQRALDETWLDAVAVFEPTPGIDGLTAADALVAGPAAMVERWRDRIAGRLEGLGLSPPAAAARSGDPGGRAGRHTPALAALLDEMTSVWRTDPEARW
jgi:ring-1,2-phenylacetyl-CoA epoxidase subunit PaaC